MNPLGEYENLRSCIEHCTIEGKNEGFYYDTRLGTKIPDDILHPAYKACRLSLAKPFDTVINVTLKPDDMFHVTMLIGKTPQGENIFHSCMIKFHRRDFSFISRDYDPIKIINSILTDLKYIKWFEEMGHPFYRFGYIADYSADANWAKPVKPVDIQYTEDDIRIREPPSDDDSLCDSCLMGEIPELTAEQLAEIEETFGNAEPRSVEEMEEISKAIKMSQGDISELKPRLQKLSVRRKRKFHIQEPDEKYNQQIEELAKLERESFLQNQVLDGSTKPRYSNKQIEDNLLADRKAREEQMIRLKKQLVESVMRDKENGLDVISDTDSDPWSEITYTSDLDDDAFVVGNKPIEPSADEPDCRPTALSDYGKHLDILHRFEMSKRHTRPITYETKQAEFTRDDEAFRTYKLKLQEQKERYQTLHKLYSEPVEVSIPDVYPKIDSRDDNIQTESSLEEFNQKIQLRSVRQKNNDLAIEPNLNVPNLNLSIESNLNVPNLNLSIESNLNVPNLLLYEPHNLILNEPPKLTLYELPRLMLYGQHNN